MHRLDRDTSGVIIVAKTETAMASLLGQFKERQVQKSYLAIVHGVPDPPTGSIETLIGRSQHDRKKMATQTRRGRSALTHYTCEQSFAGASLLRVRPHTGRTHQIRVHLAHIGHPIVGDKVYGRQRRSPTAPRQMLHAATLRFRHPSSGELMAVSADLPADFQSVLSALDRAAE